MTNVIILVIVAPILYVLLGTVYSILLTPLQTDNLKLKIVLLTFLRPITYTFLLSFILPNLFLDTWVWLSGFTLAIVLRDIIFSKTKFLSCVTTHKDKISIEYINTFLQIKHLKFYLDDDTKLQLSDMKSITDYPASLKFGDSDDAPKFIILTKKIWNSVNANLNAANIGLAQAGLTNKG